MDINQNIDGEIIEIFDSDDSNISTNSIIAIKSSDAEVKNTNLSTSDESLITPSHAEVPTNIQSYQELLDLEESSYVPNYHPFNCSICFVDYDCIQGVTLRNCLHNFCIECIVNTIKYSEEAEIKCPYKDEQYNCESFITEREIKSLISNEEYEKHLNVSLRLAESQSKNSFHCRENDCTGWCFVEDGINLFTCPVCNADNCLICKAIHSGYNCKQYQDKIYLGIDPNSTDNLLTHLRGTGEAMPCPKCQIIIMKRDGCDSIICSMCKTHICWITKGPRWGPAGPGDTSGGCRCNVNRIKCHPNCNNCH